MAEAVAVVAAISSIVQLIGFTSKVVARLNSIHSGDKESPDSLGDLLTELPVLLPTLQQIHDAIKIAKTPPKAATALLPSVNSCKKLIEEINATLPKFLPSQGDGRTKALVKSVGSVWGVRKIEGITASLRGCIATLTFYFAASSSLLLQSSATESLLKVQSWLAAPDPSQNYHIKIGSWLLDREVYKTWITNPYYVWLHGITGCGKTILSTTVLEHVQTHATDDPGTAVAYFYFNFNDSCKQDTELMVRSLVSQLLHQCIEILPRTEALSAACKRGQSPPPIESLLEVLQELIDRFPVTLIVLDALKECEDRSELMKALKKIRTWGVRGLHVLLTSRREGDITRTLERILDARNKVNIQSEEVDHDIKLYVHQQTIEEPSLQKWSSEDKEFIERSL